VNERDSSRRSLRFPEWQLEYQEALLEPDPKLVPERVAAAESAILRRFKAISNHPEHKEEIAAISDALKGLRLLQTE
jgi:hypothetical protein